MPKCKFIMKIVLIFVADTKIIFGYNFVALLNNRESIKFKLLINSALKALLLLAFRKALTLSNYADDNLFSIGKRKDQVKTFFLNPEKSQFMCIVKEINDAETLSFNDLAIKNSKKMEILGITFDRNMNFYTQKIFVEKQVKN